LVRFDDVWGTWGEKKNATGVLRGGLVNISDSNGTSKDLGREGSSSTGKHYGKTQQNLSWHKIEGGIGIRRNWLKVATTGGGGREMSEGSYYY